MTGKPSEQHDEALWCDDPAVDADLRALLETAHRDTVGEVSLPAVAAGVLDRAAASGGLEPLTATTAAGWATAKPWLVGAGLLGALALGGGFYAGLRWGRAAPATAPQTAPARPAEADGPKRAPIASPPDPMLRDFEAQAEDPDAEEERSRERHPARARRSSARTPRAPVADPTAGDATEPEPEPDSLDATLAVEAPLLARARRLVARDPAAALAATAEHARRFPLGELRYEREVIAIEALLRMGRFRQAQVRAEQAQVGGAGSAYRLQIENLFGRFGVKK